jgi:hypothetical protein
MPPAVTRPELVVDLTVGPECSGGERKTEIGEGASEGGTLCAVEVEEGVVEVEEDGAEPGQGLFRAARGHFAR